VCAGGGAKGIFQAEVIRQLVENGVTFDIVSGISAGTLNATQVAIGETDSIVDLWKSVDKKTLFGGGFNPWRIFLMLLGIKESIFDHDGIYEILEREYDPVKTEIPLIVGTVDYHNTEYVEFKVEPNTLFDDNKVKDIFRTIVASTSIPFLFPPVSDIALNCNHDFGDGGMRNLTPLSPMITRGVDEIVVITNTPRHMATCLNKLSNPIDYMKRGLNIVMNEMLREDIDNAVRVNRFLKTIQNHCPEHMPVSPSGRRYTHVDISLIEPRWDLGDILDFHPNTQQKRIEEAEIVCQKVLPLVD